MSEATILIVDDDPGLRLLVATSLALEGHRVATATDGTSALKAIEEMQPGLILLDRAMPLLDGPGLVRELQARDLDIPIVVISGADDGKRFASDINARQFLSKPFEVPQLLEVVSGMLGENAIDHQDRRQQT